MEKSIIRELYRIQDELHKFIPAEIWSKWAEANEALILWWEENNESEE